MFHLCHSVITHILCPILIYQQFRSWYWHPPGQFLCQWWFFKSPWSPWTMTVYLDEHKLGKTEKNKWVKQYTVIIACHRWKFRNQNRRYGHWNNYFGLHANFHGLFFILFQGPSQFSGYFRGLFRGINHFRGFRGCWPPCCWFCRQVTKKDPKSAKK